jgi:hypothetical protein
MLQASGVEMQGAFENSGHARDTANPDLNHLGHAPVRTLRHRAPLVQSPALHEHFLSPQALTPDHVKSESPSRVPTLPGPTLETVNKLSPKTDNIVPKEARHMGQAPVRTQVTAQLTEQHTRQHQISSGERSESAPSKSARKMVARDAEHRASVNSLLQQLEELSVSKQRIAEEFRASQQLTAQALRRLDEECDRRQQLELRVVESEAALNVLGRIFEGKTQELAIVRSKLETAESRASNLEKQSRMMCACAMNRAESNLYDAKNEESKLNDTHEAPAQSTQLMDTSMHPQVCSFIRRKLCFCLFDECCSRQPVEQRCDVTLKSTKSCYKKFKGYVKRVSLD